jgi:phosphopantetheine adenylyltransferase
MAHYNRMLAPGTETCIIPASPAYMHISGSAVRETARLVYINQYDDAVLSALVTPMVRDSLKIRLEVR